MVSSCWHLNSSVLSLGGYFSSSAVQKRRWIASAKSRGHENSILVETGEFKIASLAGNSLSPASFGFLLSGDVNMLSLGYQ